MTVDIPSDVDFFDLCLVFFEMCQEGRPHVIFTRKNVRLSLVRFVFMLQILLNSRGTASLGKESQNHKKRLSLWSGWMRAAF